MYTVLALDAAILETTNMFALNCCTWVMNRLLGCCTWTWGPRVSAYVYIPMVTTPIKRFVAWWQWRRGESSQPLRWRSSVLPNLVSWLQLLLRSSSTVSCSLQYTFEVTGPGGGLLTLMLLLHIGKSPVGQCSKKLQRHWLWPGRQWHSSFCSGGPLAVYNSRQRWKKILWFWFILINLAITFLSFLYI